MKVLYVLLACLVFPDDRLPVPDPAAQKKNEKAIRDLLKEPYQKKDQNSRRLLARTLMDTAGQEKDFDLVYSFYREAADVAADAMDFDTAMAAVERLEKTYRIEPESPLTGATFSARHEMRRIIFKRVQKAPQSIEDASAYVKAALKLADLYFSEDSFDDCILVAQMAEVVAQGSADKGLQALTRTYVRNHAALKREHDKIAKAHLRILTDPTDAEAAQAWGNFLAFILGDWPRAVEWMARGKDGPLKDVCGKEAAKAPPAELAEGWLALAEKAKDNDKGHYRTRARFWLEAAVAGGVGAEKLKYERKLEDVNRVMGITDLIRMTDPVRDYSSKGQGKGGSAKLEGTKLLVEGAAFQNGLVEFPYVPPAEYSLTIVARHAGGEFRPFAIGLSNGDHQWAVMVGLNNVTLGASPGIQNVDGKPLGLDDAMKTAASVPLGTSGTYVFTVRTTGFTVSVNGHDVIDWAGDMKRLTVPDTLSVSRRNTLFLGVSFCRYEIEKAVVVPLTGQGQRLR